MSDNPAQRVGSVHLEDMTVVALTGRADTRAPTHIDLAEDRRARLRSRLKQIGRHDWPANMQEDPLVRRGYTLRQCLRLVVALMLVDAHLPPGFAIAVARANEAAFLKVMVDRIDTDAEAANTRKADVLAVLMLGELVDLVAEGEWNATEPQRVRFVERQEVASAWLGRHDFALNGQRLILDVGGAATAVWDWLLNRRFMTGSALDQLVVELAANERGFIAGETRARRR